MHSRGNDLTTVYQSRKYSRQLESPVCPLQLQWYLISLPWIDPVMPDGIPFTLLTCTSYSHGLRTIFNLDSKLKGGIIGIIPREDAVERWFLMSHERAAITKSVEEMCEVEYGERIGTHKEASATQAKRDGDVEKLVSSFIFGLTTLFMILEDQYAAEKFLAAGIVIPDEVADGLLNATAARRRNMESCQN